VFWFGGWFWARAYIPFGEEKADRTHGRGQYVEKNQFVHHPCMQWGTQHKVTRGPGRVIFPAGWQ
jgi:hypothetical protein